MEMAVDEAHPRVWSLLVFRGTGACVLLLEWLEMVANCGSIPPTPPPHPAEDRKLGGEKRRKAQVSCEQNIKMQGNTRVLLIFRVFDQLFWNSIIYVCFQQNNFGKNLHLVQRAEPCETVVRRSEDIFFQFCSQIQFSDRSQSKRSSSSTLCCEQWITANIDRRDTLIL